MTARDAWIAIGENNDDQEVACLHPHTVHLDCRARAGRLRRLRDDRCPLGIGLTRSGGHGASFKIGLDEGFSGFMAADAILTEHGIKVVLAQIDDQWLGGPVEYVEADIGSDPVVARLAVRQGWETEASTPGTGAATATAGRVSRVLPAALGRRAEPRR